MIRTQDESTTIDCSCPERPDPDALMRDALADYQLFKCGALVDDDGRQLVVNLICLGYPRVIAMRVALQMEASRG